MNDEDYPEATNTLLQLCRLLPDRDCFLLFCDIATRKEPATRSRLSFDWGCAPNDMRDIVARLSSLSLVRLDGLIVRPLPSACDALDALTALIEDTSLEGTIAQGSDSISMVANTVSTPGSVLLLDATTNNSTWDGIDAAASVVSERREVSRPSIITIENAPGVRVGDEKGGAASAAPSYAHL